MNNRSNILTCALNLFAVRGYDAVGVQEICEAAGVTKPTLYHYFGNKQGLLEALVNERCAPFIIQLETASHYTGDLPLTLKRVVAAYFQFAMSEPTLYRMLLGLWFMVPDSEAFQVVAALNDKQQHLLETLFQQATENHGNMRNRHQTYAATFLGMINTYIVLSLNGYVKLDDRVIHQAVHQFSHGIYS